MKKIFLVLTLMAFCWGAMSADSLCNNKERKIEVSGTSTVSVMPDRITVKIGLQEYYKHLANGDSIRVNISTIENEVRDVLKKAGINGSSITIDDVGNYFNYRNPDEFLMGMQLSVVLTDMEQLTNIADNLPENGLRSFQIGNLDNSEMDKHNKEGLKAALIKAREKAVVLAETEGLELTGPIQIIEEGPLYYDEEVVMATGYVADRMMLKSNASMENIRKIVRRYNVKVTYGFKEK